MRRDDDPRLHTRLTELTGVRYPIVQTGMGWVSGPELTAATADGRRPRHHGQRDAVGRGHARRGIRTVKERTDAPFGVNLRGDAPTPRPRPDR